MYTGLHVKYPLFLSDCIEYLLRFSENTQTLNSIKIHPVEAMFSHVDRGTDKKKLTVALCNFTNVSKNVIGQGPTEGKEMRDSNS
jgi:hypothetical protein